jgi:hypothetical protein
VLPALVLDGEHAVICWELQQARPPTLSRCLLNSQLPGGLCQRRVAGRGRGEGLCGFGGSAVRRTFDRASLARLRIIRVDHALELRAIYLKQDPTYRPIKGITSRGWHLRTALGALEILTTGSDIRASKGGGGGGDLAMHVQGLSFSDAVLCGCPDRTLTLKAGRALYLLPTDWNYDIAVRERANCQWFFGVSDGFITDVLASAIVDLLARVLDDLQDCDDPASWPHLMTHQAHALEIQALTFAGRQ